MVKCRVLMMLHLSLVTFALIGCAEKVPSRPARPDSTEAGSAVMEKKSHADTPNDSQAASRTLTHAVDLVEANWKELQSLIAEQKGKIVVVDLWSTACEPCMKEFPDLVELQAAYPNELQAISFDLDFAGIKNKPVSYYRERVLAFLSALPENRILHRICTTAADELFSEIELNSIPAIYVFDRDGNIAKRFDGSEGKSEGVSYEHQVTPFVKQLIQNP